MSRVEFFGKRISGRFTIPAGIITTNISTMTLVSRTVPQVGIITTKSIGPVPRVGNREPILARFDTLSWVNAVGLTNPGVDEFVEELSNFKLPKDKFLLCSIFGSNRDEFFEVAKKLVPYVDGFELNASCPHSKGYGMSVGSDPSLIAKITKAVVSLGKPVVIKLSADMDLETTVGAALSGGINGFVSTNTLGPALHSHDGHPVLDNKLGGISGRAILPMGVKAVQTIRSMTKLPIIGCGGISTASDVLNYQKMGANFFGIGSALAGMSTREMKSYFVVLQMDISEGSNFASKKLKRKLFTTYHPFKVVENKSLNQDLFLLKLDGKFPFAPGQFVFLWIPQTGEKPFSLFDNDPAVLFIKKRGKFTKHLATLSKGDDVFLRGPYGRKFNPKGNVLLVGGGSGICSIRPFLKVNTNCHVLIGSKDKSCLPNLAEFRKYSKRLVVTTDKGDYGKKGLVTNYLEGVFKDQVFDYCFNCGPEKMIEEAAAIEKKYLPKSKIFSSVDFLTKCGVGLCGACATSKGYRSCIDGPFMKLSEL